MIQKVTTIIPLQINETVMYYPADEEGLLYRWLDYNLWEIKIKISGPQDLGITCNFGMYFILGLEAQLLSTVVRKERPQLQEQKDGLVSAIAAAKRQLLGLEDELLR